MNYPYGGEVGSCQAGKKIEVKLKGYQGIRIFHDDEMVGATAHYGPLASRKFIVVH